jgi:hypothetical protein
MRALSVREIADWQSLSSYIKRHSFLWEEARNWLTEAKTAKSEWARAQALNRLHSLLSGQMKVSGIGMAPSVEVNVNAENAVLGGVSLAQIVEAANAQICVPEDRRRFAEALMAPVPSGSTVEHSNIIDVTPDEATASS